MKADELKSIKDRQDRASAQASSILSLIRSRLFMEFRYLGPAVALPTLEATYEISGIGTRGATLLYNPLHIVSSYQQDPRRLYREYLHSVLHFVFQHPFVSSSIDHKRWNLACDIAIEQVLRSLDSELLDCDGLDFTYALIDRLQDQGQRITAENLYHYLKEEISSDEELQKWSSYVYRDSHSDWYSNMEHAAEDSSAGTESDGEPADSDAGTSSSEIRELWKNISETMQVELETWEARDLPPDALIQNLKEINRRRVDYRAFLKRFAVYDEDIRVNDEEFDYVSYTFGLQHYGNLPLIEPLEYKETKKISDFVIAIDTSGSVQGELVQKFIEKTCEILMDRESFFQKIHLRILQCDDRIREEVTITGPKELEEYLRHMRLKGFGYTDFCPVFERVKELQSEHAFSRLKGLLYFTDGYGEYPAAAPDYDAAFIYPGYDPARPEPPPWAIRVVLDSEQLFEV